MHESNHKKPASDDPEDQEESENQRKTPSSLQQEFQHRWKSERTPGSQKMHESNHRKPASADPENQEESENQRRTPYQL
jgi:hypothetical protein